MELLVLTEQLEQQVLLVRLEVLALQAQRVLLVLMAL
jgi:hypothetical protein